MNRQPDTEPTEEIASRLARRAEHLGLPLELFPPLPEPGGPLYADFVDRSDPDGQPHRRPLLDTDVFHYSDPEHLVGRCLDAAASSERLELIVFDSSLRPVVRIWQGPRYQIVREAQRTFTTVGVDEAVIASGLPKGVAEPRR